MVQCYNRSIASFTFLFQVSGYSESLNSLYKKLIIARKLPLSRVPAEIDQYFNKRQLENDEDLQKVKYDKASHKILLRSMGMNEEMWLVVAKQFSNFAIQKVIEKAIPSSSKYDVQILTEASLLQPEPFSLHFKVSKTTNAELGRTAKWEQVVVGGHSYTRATFDCFVSTAMGYPARIYLGCLLLPQRNSTRKYSWICGGVSTGTG